MSFTRTLSLCLLPVVLIMSSGCGTSPEKTSQAPDEQQPASAPAVEPLFPRVHDLGDSTLTVYEPQVLSHEGYTQITFWVAAVDEAKADGTQSIGAIKGTADMAANFEARTITLYNRRLDEIFFPELSDKERNRLTSKIKSLVRNEPETMPLDVVLAYIAQGDSLEQRAAELSMEPPDIFYAGTPAVLVQFGGEPVFKPVGKETDTSYAVNTNWDVVQSDGRYYLLLGKKWISSASLQGPWQPAAAPVRVDELPDTQQFARVRQAIPGEAIAAAEIPQVQVVTKPAELIVTDGDPVLEDVADTGLAFVSNTSHDIIYQNSSGNYYLLLSGRWFEAKQLKGPWSAVESLPQAFSRIPPEHDRAHVRVAIPGTDEAKMAVIESNIPNTASVPRGLKAPEVRYSGHPKFETIKGTQVSRAVNTSFDILRVGDRYYLCHEAVWFESDRPEGPWIVADRVPKAIYTIPADSPAYHVTFVKVYEADEDEVVVGYTSGYQSTYVSGYTVVYGTGYYWPPYWAYYPWYDDHYYWYDPYPYSYGSASYYNPVTGSYRHGDYVYGPYGGYGTGESYNERTGRRSQSEYSWDYNSVEYSSNAYNPKRGTTSETSQQFQYDSPGSYESWGESTIKKGDDWIQTRHYSNQDGRKFAYETSAGGKGARVVKDDKSLGVAKSAEGDLYVGGNGEVYRRDSDGNWQKRDSGSWNDVQTPSRERVQDRAASVTPAQRDALRQRSTTTTDRTRRYDSRRTRSMDRGTYQQLNRSYGARSYGNARFGGSRGSFSGGGFSRGGGGFSRGGGRGGGGGRR